MSGGAVTNESRDELGRAGRDSLFVVDQLGLTLSSKRPGDAKYPTVLRLGLCSGQNSWGLAAGPSNPVSPTSRTCSPATACGDLFDPVVNSSPE